MEEYLQTLLSQIRCKRAHELVRQEIEGHIEEQISENMSWGMTRQEAIKEAVKDMGDPVETGVALDSIHRPKMEWKMIGIIGVISILNLVLQYFILKDSEVIETNYIVRSAAFVVMGFVAMIIVYRLDYTLIGKYAKWIMLLGGAGIFGLLFLFRHSVNGMNSYIHIGGLPISIKQIVVLFVPVYAGVLYQYRGGKRKEVLKCIAWMAIPVGCVLLLPSLTVAVPLFFILGVLLSIAVYKEWFAVNKKKFMLGFWGTAAIVPPVILVCAAQFDFRASYVLMRLKNYFSGDPEWNYMRLVASEIMGQSKLFGNSGVDATRQLVSPINEYILTAIAAYFGTAVMLISVGVLLCLVIKIFGISHAQKNQLGMMMGYGCGMVFLVLIVSGMLLGMGLIPLTFGELPFFSASGTGTVISYILAGIVLSIYRYKNILPEKAGKARKFKIKIEEVQ